MKNILIILSVVFLLQSTYAQKDVYFKINHKLGSSAFSLNQTSANNLAENFQVTRLQYYISNIILFHDGTQTAVSDKFILADATTPMNELLGNFNITSLDSVSFGIGVGSAENHLDPSTYAATHPLAPQSPSMHWGWTAGYRFICFEGVSGTTFSDVFQMHSLGDINYQVKSIVTSGTLSGNDLDISIDADYTEGLRNINLNGGVVSHGETGAAQSVINNFNAFVFSAASASVPVRKLEELSVEVYPNPVKTGSAVFVDLDQSEDYTFQLFDMTGKLYSNFDYTSNAKTLIIKDAGIYLLNVLKDGMPVHTHTITVNE